MSDSLSLSNQAYYTIRRDILTCRLLPGSLVTESELMDRYQSGKSTIRLALTRLSHDKLVISRPRKGYRIAPVTVQDVEEIFTLRAALEPLAARLAVGKVDIELLKDLEAQCRVEVAAPLSTRIDVFMNANKRFHLTIAEATGNGHLIRTLSGLMDEMARLVALGFNVQRIKPEIKHDHNAMIDAFIEGDAKRVEFIARRHIETFQTMTLEKIYATLSKEGTLLPVLPREIFE
ncbi:GntR family transcriptional regulator [Affinibrenneria salicis]|uniref:GntR family transcriptional regulator n=1 Tax=Affinibrenneria salicis TaxID=2590031 RepID=A0A5J5G7Q1_9GAMM|nr:GntR family transcriptional regulator [Affinibrenneria salicis]KAA9002720.1 GntR family transcriptional regulator [Affinibrenneria salicis]KAA9002993.1 GntR family transcriptional regulator [Affinibrenneria salicis]